MSNRPLRFAPLTAADAPAYRHLMLQAYELSPLAFTSTPDERASAPEAWWVTRIADPQGGSQAFGAYDGDQLVGSVALEYSSRTKTRHQVLVIGMFVKPAYQGLGAGRALIDMAVAHARARPGIRTMGLTVTEGNAPALALYAAAGFEVWGTEPMAVHTDEGFKAKHHMSKLLTVSPAS